MYKIGQVLWLVMTSTKSVTPVQVISKVTQENLDGVSVQHIVHDTSNTKHCIEKIKGHVFESPEEAESHLLLTASELITQLIALARESAKAFQPKSDVEQPSNLKITEQDDRMVVELPDGTKARVNIPEALR